MGYRLSPEEVHHLVVKKEILVDYGTAYFVNPKNIREFFHSHRSALENAGIHLHPKYYGSREVTNSANR